MKKAQKYIFIEYFIIKDGLMWQSILDILKEKVSQGVDVRIITPHIYDKALIHLTTRSFYRELIYGGVKIYEYSKGFMHSKIFVSDDQIATVGTTNLDFRSLYLHFECGSMDAIEQTYMWNEETFEQYTIDNKPGEKQRAIMELIKEEFQIIPMEQPFFYIKDLQASFDYSNLVFSEEYYELLPKVEELEIAAPEWKVTYEGGFYPKRGRARKEIRVDKEFKWGNEI